MSVCPTCGRADRGPHQKVTLDLDSELLARLDHYAAEHDVWRSLAIEWAMADFLSRPDPPNLIDDDEPITLD